MISPIDFPRDMTRGQFRKWHRSHRAILRHETNNNAIENDDGDHIESDEWHLSDQALKPVAPIDAYRVEPRSDDLAWRLEMAALDRQAKRKRRPRPVARNRPFNS